MRDVSPLFAHFRVSVRRVWNTCFWADSSYRTWDSYERYEEIRRMLFDALVLARLECEWNRERIFREPLPSFHVMPTLSTSVPIMINNPRPEGPGYWDEPLSSVSGSEIELHFIDYFDWNRLDYVDFQYFLVRIAAFPKRPDLVGRDALMDCHYAGVFFDEK